MIIVILGIKDRISTDRDRKLKERKRKSRINYDY